MNLKTDNQEGVIFQKKSAQNLGVYFFIKSTINIFAVLGLCAMPIIFAFLKDAPRTIKFLSAIQESIYSGSIFNINSLSFQGKLILYTFIFIIISGLLTLLIPLFFSFKALKERKIVFTDTRCFINSSNSLTQIGIDYDCIACVTLSYTWIEKYLNMATIFILDKNALSTDPRVNHKTIKSLRLSGLNMQDAKNIIEFFEEKNIKTEIKNEKLLDSTMSSTVSEISTRTKNKL